MDFIYSSLSIDFWILYNFEAKSSEFETGKVRNFNDSLKRVEKYVETIEGGQKFCTSGRFASHTRNFCAVIHH